MAVLNVAKSSGVGYSNTTQLFPYLEEEVTCMYVCVSWFLIIVAQDVVSRQVNGRRNNSDNNNNASKSFYVN